MLGVPLEPLLPVLGAAHDLRGPADPLPARAGHEPAVAVDRGGGEQPHHVVALEVAVGEREQAEEPAAERAVGERADGGAVVGDAGRVQLLVHEARVRLGRAVEHRHAFEGHAVAHRVDDQAHDGSHLVVGIRRRDDPRRRPARSRAVAVGQHEIEPAPARRAPERRRARRRSRRRRP